MIVVRWHSDKNWEIRYPKVVWSCWAIQRDIHTGRVNLYHPYFFNFYHIYAPGTLVKWAPNLAFFLYVYPMRYAYVFLDVFYFFVLGCLRIRMGGMGKSDKNVYLMLYPYPLSISTTIHLLKFNISLKNLLWSTNNYRNLGRLPHLSYVTNNNYKQYTISIKDTFKLTNFIYFYGSYSSLI